MSDARKELMVTSLVLFTAIMVFNSAFLLLVYREGPPGPPGDQGPTGPLGRPGEDGQDALPWFGATFRVRFTCRLVDCTDMRMDLIGAVEQYGQVRYILFILDDRFQVHAPQNQFVVIWNGSSAMLLTLRFHVEDTGFQMESPAYLVRNGSAWINWEVSVR